MRPPVRSKSPRGRIGTAARRFEGSAPIRALARPWVAGALAALVVRLPTLGGGFDNDVAIYLTGGFAWPAGDLPYRDIFDHKGPLNPELFLALDWLLPTSPTALRLAMLAVICASLAQFAALVGRHAPEAAWVATVVYAIAISTPLLQGHDLNTEQWALAAGIAAADLADRSRAGQGRRALALAALAGAAVAAAVGLKSIYLVAAVPVPLLFLARERDRLAAFGVGAAAALALILVPYALAGTLDDLWAAVVTYSHGFASARLGDVIDGGAGSVLEYVTEHPATLLVGFGLVLGTVALRDERTRPATGVAILALGGGWLAARLPGESYVHYFLLTVPGLAVLCGLGVDSLAARSSTSRITLAAMVVVPIGFALGLAPIRDALRIAPEQRWGTTALPCLDAQRRTAAAIRDLTDPEDRIYVSTGDSLNYYGQQIYWQARRLPASRYIFPRDVEPPAYLEVADDLRRSPPAAIALMPGGEHAEVAAAIRDQDMRPIARIECGDGTAIEVLA